MSVLLLLAAPARAQTQNDDDESALLVKEARGKLKKGDYDGAGKLLDRAIEVNPRRLEAYILRASVYAVKKQYKQGIALMRRAEALAPDDENVLVALGTQLMLAGQVDEGVPLLEKVVTRWPRRYEAHALLGHHYADAGEWQKAIASLEAYLKTRPSALAGEDPLHQVPLADAYLRSGDPRHARELFVAILKLHPDDEAARIGLAWATAAIDCREALPLLAKLQPLAEKYPDILLVEGRCALLTGKGGEALALARRYLKVRPDSAAGHGLAGEALADGGDVGGARSELSEARRLDPKNRRWGFKLARMERLSGQPATAVALLEELGPTTPGDPEWSVELGEALLADGRAEEAKNLLEPVVDANPQHAGALTVFGAAKLKKGFGESAAGTLERALAIAPSPRVRGLLVDALNLWAVQAMRAGELPEAEVALVRAEEVAASNMSARNLGIVRLMAGRPADAVEPLSRAAAGGDDAGALHLYARALGLTGKTDEARKAFAAARKLLGSTANLATANLALDLAAMELDAGDPERAIDALEGVTDDERIGPALVTAWHAAAVKALAAGAPGRAQKLLEQAEKKAAPELLVAIRCDLALAATAAGDREAALKRLRALAKSGAVCPFPAPADKLAVPMLIALNEGLAPARAGKALDQLDKLAKQATGVAQRLWTTAIRMVAMTAAADAYARGNTKKARELLLRAKKAEARGLSPELSHDLVALDVADGKGAASVPVLIKLTADVPEAWITLGLAYEQDGKPIEALDAYRQAEKAGVRFAPLADWIAAKERVFGGAP